MRVAILGCGYVGIALARQLQTDGHDVFGVRRSRDGLRAIEQTRATAIQADVTDAESLRAVPDVDAIVFAASTGGGGADEARTVYVEGLQTVIRHFGDRDDPPNRLVYTSSTGVYGDHEGTWVDESTPADPTTPKTRVLLTAEQLVREANAANMSPTVVRFAGLYGPRRYRLERYLNGPVTEGYLNMLHRVDAAGILAHILELSAPPELILAVDNEPVDRRELAEWLADACGVNTPATQTIEERLATDNLTPAASRRLQTRKRCSNELIRNLGYSFVYPTYREGYAAAIRAYRTTH